jgi:hypothetical protein
MVPDPTGVAQGWPLSPLLFLIVAEAMKVAIDRDMYPNWQTIPRYFLDPRKSSSWQMKRSVDVMPSNGHEGKCEKKRGTIAMGKYRTQDQQRGIKWAKEKEGCVSLGVPIGNELDESKWWSEKIYAVRKKTR